MSGWRPMVRDLATVDGIPVSVRILLDGITGRWMPGARACVHAAAAAPAWVRTGRMRAIRTLRGAAVQEDRPATGWRAAAADPALAGGCWLKRGRASAAGRGKSARGAGRGADELEDELRAWGS